MYTICLNIQRATRLAASNQWPGSEEHVHKSQRTNMLHKKVNGSRAIGPDLLNQNLQFGATPPGLLSSFFFLILVLMLIFTFNYMFI